MLASFNALLAVVTHCQIQISDMKHIWVLEGFSRTSHRCQRGPSHGLFLGPTWINTSQICLRDPKPLKLGRPKWWNRAHRSTRQCSDSEAWAAGAICLNYFLKSRSCGSYWLDHFLEAQILKSTFTLETQWFWKESASAVIMSPDKGLMQRMLDMITTCSNFEGTVQGLQAACGYWITRGHSHLRSMERRCQKVKE